jgi:two-component system sensor histidine kinase AdeS
MKLGLRLWLLVLAALAAVTALVTLMLYFFAIDWIATQAVKAAIGEVAFEQFMNGEVLPEVEEKYFAIYEYYNNKWFFALGFLVSFIAAGIIGWFGAHPLLRHMAALRQTAATIRLGDLSARVGNHRLSAAEINNFASDFNALIDRVERAERETRESAAALAHELRTPLTVIRGRVQGMIDGVFTTDAAALHLLLRQVELLNRLVEDLRFLTLFEAGRMVFRTEQLQLDTLIREVLTSYPKLQHRLAKLRIQGDAARLTQAIAVLLDNATRHAGGADKVELTLETGEAVLRVMDRGPGLSDNEADRVFDRFFRAEGSAPDGSGLGLSVARAVVKGHGGRIRALPRLGGGTVFEIHLPRIPLDGLD